MSVHIKRNKQTLIRTIEKIQDSLVFSKAVAKIKKLRDTPGDINKAKLLYRELVYGDTNLHELLDGRLLQTIETVIPPYAMARILQNLTSIAKEWGERDQMILKLRSAPRDIDPENPAIKMLRDQTTGMEDRYALNYIKAMQAAINAGPYRNLFFIGFNTFNLDSIPILKDTGGGILHQRVAIVTSIIEWGGRKRKTKEPYYHELRGLVLNPISSFATDQTNKRGKHANTIIIDCQPGRPGIVCMTDSSRYIDKFIKLWLKTTSLEKREEIATNFADITGITISADMNEDQVAERYIKGILEIQKRGFNRTNPIERFFNNRGVDEIHYKILHLPISNDDGPNCMRLSLMTCYYFLFIDKSYNDLLAFINHAPFDRVMSISTIEDTEYPEVLGSLVLQYLPKIKF